MILTELPEKETQLMTVSTDVKRQRKVITIVSEFTHVPVELIVGRSRKEEIVYARQLAVYFLNKYTGYNQVKIGEILGNRDHSTIIHSLRVMSDRLATDDTVVTDVESLDNIFENRL